MATDSRPSGRFAFPWYVWAGGALLLLAVAAFAYWTISPLFIDRAVDESFPTSAALVAAQPTDEAMAESTPTGEAMAESTPTGEAMMESTPTGEAMMESTPTGEAMMESTPTGAAAAQVATEPVSLGAGSFTTIDSLHGASGSATIYQLPAGELVLRLENFDAQNGPDLFVGLSGHPMPRSNDEVHASGYLELARLKANQGNQNYDLPADIDLSQYKSVVIYCRAFSVVFSTAELGK